MKIPSDAIIPMEKLTHYLLVEREWDDKAKFLGQTGFTLTNPDALLEAIRQLAITAEAEEDRVNEYGEFFRTEGWLTGPNGRSLAVVMIWLRWRTDGKVRFVTLKPRKEKKV